MPDPCTCGDLADRWGHAINCPVSLDAEVAELLATAPQIGEPAPVLPRGRRAAIEALAGAAWAAAAVLVLVLIARAVLPGGQVSP